MNSRSVKACPGSRIRGCCRGGGRYVGDMVLPGMVHRLRAALAARPCAHPHRSTRRKAKAAPGVLAVLTGADWQASGWGDLPVPAG